jgi:ribosomal protein S12 methylthiotransferase accessory factor
VIFEENFTIGEFKAQLHLTAGNIDEAVGYLEFGNNIMGNLIIELIRLEELGLDLCDYQKVLYDLYTSQRVDKALEILNKEALLVNTVLHRDYLNMLELYDRLEVKKVAAF